MIASSTTPIVPTTTVQTISQCYDCSGPECGKPGSSVTTNCPSCMVYRNPNDQSKNERITKNLFLPFSIQPKLNDTVVGGHVVHPIPSVRTVVQKLIFVLEINAMERVWILC